MGAVVRGDGGGRQYAVVDERVATLEPNLEAPRTARSLLRSFLEELGRSEWVESGELAISEVVTNAALHAHTAIQLRLEGYEDRACVEVRDFNPTLPVRRNYDREATTGRGLDLVAAITVACGVRGLPDGKVVWFCVGEDEHSDQELLAAWGLQSGDELPTGMPFCDVVLVSLPATLWLAARQHHDAVLRELVLYSAAHDGVEVDMVAADEARSIISVAAAAAVEAAQAEGTARPALPEGHPSPLPWVPDHLDLRIRVAADSAATFAALQDTLDVAERLAAEGELLIRPALPEIVAVRDWACEQIIAQLGGTEPSPWPGTAQERFEVEITGRVAAVDSWDPSAVLEAEQSVVAADDSNRIVAVSRHFAALVGWDPEALVGRRVVTLIPPALREAHVAGFTRHLTTGEAHALGVPLTLPVLHRDGTEITCTFLVEQVATRPRSIYVAWIQASPAP